MVVDRRHRRRRRRHRRHRHRRHRRQSIVGPTSVDDEVEDGYDSHASGSENQITGPVDVMISADDKSRYRKRDANCHCENVTGSEGNRETTLLLMYVECNSYFLHFMNYQ